MKIDKESLSKVLSLSDEEFKSKVSAAADAAGMPQDKTNMILRDVKNIKKQLSVMSEADLKRAATMIGTDKLEEMMKILTEKT